MRPIAEPLEPGVTMRNSDHCVTLQITRELYVVPPLMGYAQAVVLEPLSGQFQDILCGATIIKNPIEGIRAKHSRIMELVGSIRTQTTYWNSLYRLMTSQVSKQ